MLHVWCQNSGLSFILGDRSGVNYKSFCFLWESVEFSKHSRWPNTAMKNRNCMCFLSVCVIRSENRGQSGSTESVKSKSNNLFLSMNSCSVLDVNVSMVSDQTLEIRRLRVGILTLNFPKGLWLLDLFLCVFALHLRPELTRTVWPVTADRGVWLAFISFPFWMKRTWCKWEEMSWFIHNAAWIFHLGSGRAACLDGTLLCCGQIPSDFLTQ